MDVFIPFTTITSMLVETFFCKKDSTFVLSNFLCDFLYLGIQETNMKNMDWNQLEEKLVGLIHLSLGSRIS